MTSQNSFVSIQIALTDISVLTKYLIEQQVSFRMDFQPEKIVETASIPVQTIGEQSDIEEDEVFVSRNRDEIKIVKEIHHKYLIENIGNIPPPEREIARIFGIRVVSFKTIFKKMYGNTFYQYYVQKKMENACQLLQKGYTANEVSAKVGYTHAIKFNKMFQKYIGMTPKQYQVKHYGSRNKRDMQRIRVNE